MEVFKIPFDQVPQFSQKDVDYALARPKLRPFYKYEVSLENFRQVIEDRKQFPFHRAALVDSLTTQYASKKTSEKVQKNIELLALDNTFTVTTAHQPVLFTGPFYYIFKIFSTINLAEQLHDKYPEYNFVPIFINGAEDHDFDEINHTTVRGKTITWQTAAGGPVGELPASSLTMAINELKHQLGESINAERLITMIKEAYTHQKTHGAATNHLVDELFKDYGLVVVDMGTRILKSVFQPYMERELFEQVSVGLVQKTQEALMEVDFTPQAFARDINLFYIQPGIRARIEKVTDDLYQIVDTAIRFSKEALKKELQQYPERFSPNVVMRPVYQELILPNLAYIGGGGELAYWLERKSQFEAFGLNYPMLIRRNSAMWVSHRLSKKIKKLGLTLTDLFMDTETLIKKFVDHHSHNELSLQEELQTLESVFEQYSRKARKVDPTLEPRTLAIGAKYRNTVQKLEKRLMRQEKKKYHQDIETIRMIKEQLFPGNNGLQERKINFMEFFLGNGDFLFECLRKHLDPMQRDMLVFVED